MLALLLLLQSITPALAFGNAKEAFGAPSKATGLSSEYIELNCEAAITTTEDDGNRIGMDRQSLGTVGMGYGVTGVEHHQYLVDTSQPYAEVIQEAEWMNNALPLITRYDIGLDRLRMFKYQVTSNGPPPVYSPVVSGWYLFDGLGSTRAVVDDGGVGQSEFGYGDAFGIPYQVAANGTRATAGAGFFLNGQQWDGSGVWNSGEGLYFNRARYYQPGLGRFIGQDSFAGIQSDPITLHRYIYAINDSINNVDPSGNVHIILSGGVRTTTDGVHDKTADNFLRQARRYAAELALRGDTAVCLAYYSTAFRKRAKKDGKSEDFYINETMKHSLENDYCVSEYRSTRDLVSFLNRNSEGDVDSIHYFGHSNSGSFLINYGEDNANPVKFEKSNVDQINKKIFHASSYVRLYGCNLANSSYGEPLGQYISKKWGVPVLASTTTTVYTSDTIFPFTSNEDPGKWVKFEAK